MANGETNQQKQHQIGLVEIEAMSAGGRCSVPDAPAHEYVEPDRGAGLWRVVPPAGRLPVPGRTWLWA